MTAPTNPYSGLIKHRQRVKASRREAARKKRLIAAELAPVFRHYGIEKAYLFGSVTRGNCFAESDIDLYVEPVPPNKFWSLWRELEIRADQQIDLYCQRDDPEFVSKIKQRGELIYESRH